MRNNQPKHWKIEFFKEALVYYLMQYSNNLKKSPKVENLGLPKLSEQFIKFFPHFKISKAWNWNRLVPPIPTNCFKYVTNNSLDQKLNWFTTKDHVTVIFVDIISFFHSTLSFEKPRKKISQKSGRKNGIQYSSRRFLIFFKFLLHTQNNNKIFSNIWGD